MLNHQISENATLSLSGNPKRLDPISRVSVSVWNGERSAASKAGASTTTRHMILVKSDVSMALGEPMELVHSFQ